MIKFIAMVIRLFKSLFLPKVTEETQVTPKGTHPSQAWQSMVMLLCNRYGGSLICKETSIAGMKLPKATRWYKLGAINASMVAKEDGAISIIEDGTGHDITELVMANAQAGQV